MQEVRERGRNQNKKLEEDICEPVSRVNQERMITWQKKRQIKWLLNLAIW
nr:MAG TPA: hypothetical protein [Caudoviricetes sp.]